MIPEIQVRQKELETRYMSDVMQTDEAALALYNSGNAKKAQTILTDFSCQAGARTFNTWKGLYAYLFTKYMDGNIKTPVAGQRNPSLKQPGYNEEWYRMVVGETGDKFKNLGEGGH
jgi:hypothetical protein